MMDDGDVYPRPCAAFRSGVLENLGFWIHDRVLEQRFSLLDDIQHRIEVDVGDRLLVPLWPKLRD